MLNYINIFTPLIAVMFYMVSCSGSRSIEKTIGLRSIIANPEAVVLKKAKVLFKDGTNSVLYDLVALNGSFFVNDFVPSIGLRQSHFELRSFDQQDFTAIQYSNTNLRIVGLISGGLMGVGGAFLLSDARVLFPLNALFALLSPPVGMGIGYTFGAQFYIKFQEYPLNNNAAIPMSNKINPSPNTLLLKLKIPLNWQNENEYKKLHYYSLYFLLLPIVLCTYKGDEQTCNRQSTAV